MEFRCKVRVIDQMMGEGKTSAAINHINNSTDNERFIVITPYLSEVEKYKSCCKDKNFQQPAWKRGAKMNGLKDLVRQNANIVSTHALFSKFDADIIEMCKTNNYTLIMDEVANVIEEYQWQLTTSDYEILAKDFLYIDEDTHQLRWRKDKQDYCGEFSDIKRLCNLGSLANYSGTIMMWLFPIDVFNSFRNVYIMTYMFEAQMQKYYYDYYKVPYTYMHIEGNSAETYHFCDGIITDTRTIDYANLIHILENEKMNSIGKKETDLSKAWFNRNKKSDDMEQLKNNIHNFFHNICKAKSKDTIWTTFKTYRYLLQGKGYTKGFLALNIRATNEYKARTAIAYIANRYMNPILRNFFTMHGITIDEDAYALSEMLQFIWRSAIRDGKEIWIYIPSIRMRNLLKKWIIENSPKK